MSLRCSVWNKAICAGLSGGSPAWAVAKLAAVAAATIPASPATVLRIPSSLLNLQVFSKLYRTLKRFDQYSLGVVFWPIGRARPWRYARHAMASRGQRWREGLAQS